MSGEDGGAILGAIGAEAVAETVETKIAALQDLLGDDESGELVAQLWRADKPTSAREFLDELQPEEVRLSHIKRTYGGGGYAITIHGPKGRLVKNILFRIAGSPKADTPAPVAAASDKTDALIHELREERRAAEARQFELTKLMLEQRNGGGGGNGLTFADALAIAKMIGEKKTASPLDAIKEAREMVGLLQGENGGGGGDWAALASEGLSVFSALLNQQPAASVAPVSKVKRLPPGSAPVAPAPAAAPAPLPPAILQQIAEGLSTSLEQVADDSAIVQMILESSPPPLLQGFLPALQADTWEATFKPHFKGWAKKRARLTNIRNLLLEAVKKEG